jgi:hypothetical protein
MFPPWLLSKLGISSLNQLQINKVFVRVGHRFPPFSISIADLRDSVASGKIDPSQAFICFQGAETWHRLSSNMNLLTPKKEKRVLHRPEEAPLGKLVLSAFTFTLVVVSSVIIWWLTNDGTR